ncbi:MAG: IPT/TIG domain-containing protein, partial [Chloroflexales bacterium]
DLKSGFQIFATLTGVTPGQPYFYKFTVVKTDMTESDYSNVAQGTPLDTIPPVITHTRVTSAAPGMPLTLFADATDNVGVQAVTLRFRTIGTTDYTARTMTRTTGNRYAATIEGSQLVSPGVEYYIEASDGISTVRSGRPEYPWQVIVVDRPVVNVVTPSHGPAAGGAFVTIAGSNFKTNATVSFGGMPASSVTVVSASQITCTTAAHFPAAVDVVVRNPDTQSGTLLLGYTYESAVASLSLPNTGGPRYGTVQVPINAANVLGLAAASLTVTFDSSVLRGRGALTGSLTPGWSVAVNTNTQGQLRLSMASPGSTSTGSGVLAYVEFEVLGSPGATSPLTLTSVSLNDGAIQTETAAGSFAVNVVYDIRGTVSFWNGGAAVPGVLCTLQGDRVYTGTSGSNGTFTVAGADAGNYTLTPAKSDDVNGISAYDASLVLQHDAGLITLSGRAATAADVNKSGQITAFDAFYILQKAVDLITLPFPGAGQVWVFDPANRSYTGLSSSQAGQNFTGILLGDVSGNWSMPALPPLGGGTREPKDGSPPVVLALRSLTTRSNGTQLWLLANVPEPGLVAVAV